MLIADAVRVIRAKPAPVLIVDTCSLLDLFRCDEPKPRPRAPSEEIEAATEIRQLMATSSIYLIAPELVPREFQDNADGVVRKLQGWIELLDENQNWLTATAPWLGLPFPEPIELHTLGLPSRCRALAEDLLAGAIQLDRDGICLDRAIARLIAKRRPSHKNEVKDSMNVEQALELSRQLKAAGFSKTRAFVSSNTRDFTEGAERGFKLAPDLQADFADAGLEYYTSLRAAHGSIQAKGEFS